MKGPSLIKLTGIAAFWLIPLSLLYYFGGLKGILILFLSVGSIWWLASSHVRRQKRRRAALGIDDAVHAALQRRQSAEVTIKGRKFVAAVNSIGELSLTPKDPFHTNAEAIQDHVEKDRVATGTI
jgi:hypothetical protein